MKIIKSYDLNSLFPSTEERRKGVYPLLENYWFQLNFLIMKRVLKPVTVKSMGATKRIPMWSRIAIELHSDCNRDCYFCPRYADSSGIRKDKKGKHTKKSMPTQKIFDIIDQAEQLGYKGIVGFHRLSEPFLDKRYIEVSSYVKEKGMKVCDNTNGDIMKKDDAFCKKIDGILDEIKIGLYDYKNNREKREQMRFWKSRFKKTKVSFSLAAEYPMIRINSKLDGEGKRIIKSKTRNYPCLWPIIGLYIRYDGEVSFCCDDDECKFGLGNVFNSSIKDIWWSKKHIELINSLRLPGNRNYYQLCKNCKLPGSIPYRCIVTYPELNFF